MWQGSGVKGSSLSTTILTSALLCPFVFYCTKTNSWHNLTIYVWVYVWRKSEKYLPKLPSLCDGKFTKMPYLSFFVLCCQRQPHCKTSSLMTKCELFYVLYIFQKHSHFFCLDHLCETTVCLYDNRSMAAEYKHLLFHICSNNLYLTESTISTW